MEINVSKCKFYSEIDNCCHIEQNPLTATPCEYTKNCTYKQLQQLKQKNEELDNENDNLREANEQYAETNKHLEYMLDDVISKVLKDDTQEDYFYVELKQKFTEKLENIICENDELKERLAIQKTEFEEEIAHIKTERNNFKKKYRKNRIERIQLQQENEELKEKLDKITKISLDNNCHNNGYCPKTYKVFDLLESEE